MSRDSRNETDNDNIDFLAPLVPPAILMDELKLTDEAKASVIAGRVGFHNILTGEDDRLAVVVGPCSIHDTKAALEYALQLKEAADELKDELLIIMRVYFEKPRTTVGWKGLINDPGLDGTFMINKGLRIARKLLLDINELGLPCGVEFLDVISPQFVGDLVAWGAIGARTTESQVHRELASGLSCPVGFKNGTSGDVNVAAAALQSSSAPHHFLSVSKQGLAAIVHTKGNPNCHVILRGGTVSGPNFDDASVAHATELLRKKDQCQKLVIDLSHGNSNKQHQNQIIVGRSVASQIAAGNKNICGVMIESNINEGNQKIPTDLSQLQYGVSVTDACVSWENTLPILRMLAAATKQRRLNDSPTFYRSKI